MTVDRPKMRRDCALSHDNTKGRVVYEYEYKGRTTPWDSIKQGGSEHYKGKEVEPIDLYKHGNMLRDWALAEIMQHAYRNRLELGEPISHSDMEKIVHYAQMLMAL